MSQKSPKFATKTSMVMVNNTDKEDLQIVYNTLSRYRSEYYCSNGKNQSRIEESVRMYGDTLPGDLYLKLNQGSASGLFRPTFFQRDLDRSLRILEEELNQ